MLFFRIFYSMAYLMIVYLCYLILMANLINTHVKMTLNSLGYHIRQYFIIQWKMSDTTKKTIHAVLHPSPTLFESLGQIESSLSASSADLTLHLMCRLVEVAMLVQQGAFVLVEFWYYHLTFVKCFIYINYDFIVFAS